MPAAEQAVLKASEKLIAFGTEAQTAQLERDQLQRRADEADAAEPDPQEVLACAYSATLLQRLGMMVGSANLIVN